MVIKYFNIYNFKPKLIQIKPENPSPIPPSRIGPQQQIGLNKDDEVSIQRTNIIGTPTPMVQPVQLQPTFHYRDIQIYSQDGLALHLKDPSSLAFFQLYPQFKVLCKTAIVSAIRELISK